MKAMFLFWIGLLVVLAPTAAKADSCPKTLAELAQSGKACDLPAAGIRVTRQDVELRVADAPPTTVLNAASTGKRAFYLTAAKKVLRCSGSRPLMAIKSRPSMGI